MTSVNVTTQKNTVTVQQGDATTVTVTTQGALGATGAAGAGISAGDKGALTVAANLTDWTLNDSVVTNVKVASDAAIAGSKISPNFGSQNITTTGNAVFGGNLTVSGTTTTIDTTTLTVEDKNIELGKVGSPTDTTADGGGITLLGDTNHTFNWLNATDSWTSSEHIALPDDKKLQLGDSQDLQIFHTGIHSHIRDAGSGSLLLQGSKIVVQNADGSETNASFTENGAVELYHDAVKKLETTSNGATVNGHLLASTDGNTTISLLDTGHGFPQSEIKLSNGGRDLNIVAPKDIRLFPQSGENGIVIEANGQVELYHDNVKKAETSSTGLDVTGAVKASTGILFGSDTADDNKLSDYEQGTFTPTLEGSSSNPTVNYHTQSGHYTKIGNVVHIQLLVITNSYSGGSGEWQCGGLPFTASSSAPNSFNFNWQQNNTIDWGSGTSSLGIFMTGNTTKIKARKFASNTDSALQLSAFSSSQLTVFGVHGSYIAA